MCKRQRESIILFDVFLGVKIVRIQKGVWLGASAIVKNEKDELLVVEKAYGGLKGLWSFPAGFAEQGETLDETAAREVLEETGVQVQITHCLGIRTGILSNDISDHLVMFYGCVQGVPMAIPAAGEIVQVKWLPIEQLVHSKKSSLMVRELSGALQQRMLEKKEDFDPGRQFGYKSYHLFL